MYKCHAHCHQVGVALLAGKDNDRRVGVLQCFVTLQRHIQANVRHSLPKSALCMQGSLMLLSAFTVFASDRCVTAKHKGSCHSEFVHRVHVML